jgi:hypothetical protein
MCAEKMEGGAGIEWRETQPACREEIEGGMKIELWGTQLACREEIEGGGETRDVIGNAFVRI